jgi:predicted nucleic acid-binding Zn ribbon protein
MPLRDGYCRDCQTTTEFLLKHDESLPECEKCGGKLKQLPPKSRFALRGIGWGWDGYSKTSRSESD